MPRQGMHTGKRSQARKWQASQAGTANVPRQGTGKCSQAGNRRRPQAGDSGCSHAGNCRHCKSLATICHQPRGATPPPTSHVLCDELACLLTGQGAIVNHHLSYADNRQQKIMWGIWMNYCTRVGSKMGTQTKKIAEKHPCFSLLWLKARSTDA